MLGSTGCIANQDESISLYDDGNENISITGGLIINNQIDYFGINATSDEWMVKKPSYIEASWLPRAGYGGYKMYITGKKLIDVTDYTKLKVHFTKESSTSASGAEHLILFCGRDTKTIVNVEDNQIGEEFYAELDIDNINGDILIGVALYYLEAKIYRIWLE